MTTTSAAPQPTPSPAPAVTLRGTERGLEIVVDADASADAIAEGLERRLEPSPDFFAENDVYVRYEAPLPPGGLSRLEAVASRFDLRIVEVSRTRPRSEPRVEEDPPAPERVQAPEPSESVDITEEVCADEPATPEPAIDRSPRIVVGPIRSGSVVEAAGDLVVLGDVNPGADLRAERSVIVLGALRGVAHAGCTGRTAVIFALRLAPQQLRIAELIARAGGDNAGRTDTPEIAYAAGGQIIVEDYRGKLPSGITAADL